MAIRERSDRIADGALFGPQTLQTMGTARVAPCTTHSVYAWLGALRAAMAALRCATNRPRRSIAT